VGRGAAALVFAALAVAAGAALGPPACGRPGRVSILVPGDQTHEQVRALITHARQRAKDRYRPPQ
jgi:hypothetical protein